MLHIKRYLSDTIVSYNTVKSWEIGMHRSAFFQGRSRITVTSKNVAKSFL